MPSEPSFSGPTETFSFDAVLLDFDGTIIDSTDAIVKHWHKLGKELGVDPNVILETSHGRRSIDVLQLYDPSKANWEYVSKIEGVIPREYGSDAVEIPGARAFLKSLDAANVLWAVVTSGTRALVDGWLDVMKLSHPKNLVTAEDVTVGKPDPSCYLLGLSRLHLDTDAHTLVVEDAPSGIRAGKAAGFKVVALATTHKIEELKEAGADWIIKDLRSLVVTQIDADSTEVSIEIRDTLRW